MSTQSTKKIARGLSRMMQGTVLVAALTLGTLAGAPAHAAPSAATASQQQGRAVTMELVTRIASMTQTQRLDVVRAGVPELRAVSDAKVMQVLRAKIHFSAEAPEGAVVVASSVAFDGKKSGPGAGVASPLVSGIGSGTLWFGRAEMAWWATAGTAAVIAALVAVGVPGITVWQFAGALIATFWQAYWSGYCAWFTYRGRLSVGTYRC